MTPLWILILIVFINGRDVEIIQHTFLEKAACENVLKLFRGKHELSPYSIRGYGGCFPKKDTSP